MAMFPPDSVAFITGAGSGIGTATALQLAKDGIKKFALIDISPEGLKTTSTSITNLSLNHNVLEIVASVAKESEVNDAVAGTVKEFGKIDVAVNAAGITGDIAKMEDQKTENLEKVLGVNLLGVWFCERAEIKQMMKQEMRGLSTGLPYKTRGSIVNIGSIESVSAMGYSNHYAIAKHGVLGLTRSDCVDYAGEGIRINCVCPGFIDTPLVTGLYDSEIFRTQMLPTIPIRRPGLPEEVAFTVSWLASDRASYSNGAAIVIDGGKTVEAGFSATAG